MALAGMIATLGGSEGHLVSLVKVVVALGGLLLLWRIWRFTIAPSFRPSEPKELPYWIPYVGKVAHIAATGGCPNRIWTNQWFTDRYFRNTREIFSIVVAGQKMYIVTAPKDISTVYKNPQTLTFDGFIKDMYAQFGMSPIGIEKMFAPTVSTHDTVVNVPNQQHVHLGTGVQKEQLHPGHDLDALIRIYLSYIEPQMDMERIPDRCIVQSFSDRKVVSLRDWCSSVLGLATVEAFFGRSLLELDPQLLEDFHTFDVDSWMLLYQYPRIAAKSMYDAMDRTTNAFTRYFETRVEARSRACHYIETVEAKQRKGGMSNRDIAIAAHGLFWAANANHHKICFWFVAHIVYDSALLDIIRKEITPAIRNGKVDIQYLIEQCPVFDAAFNETLRLTTGANSARTVDAATNIGHQTLYPSAKLLIPYRQLHYDEEFFGPNVNTFNPLRFLDNKDLHKSPYFKPFGGGLTYCSGRFLARREVMGLAAVILTQYELNIDNKEKGFPRLDLNKPNVGVMDSVGGDDVLLEIRPRVL